MSQSNQRSICISHTMLKRFFNGLHLQTSLPF